jgi:hypothetical protein
MITHGCSPDVLLDALRGRQMATSPSVFAQVRAGAPPGTRTPNPRIKSTTEDEPDGAG